MQLRAIRIAVLLLWIGFVPVFARAATILDTLGDFTTADEIPLPGSAGLAMTRGSSAGPFFQLSRPWTRITEIGAFLRTCVTCEDALFAAIYRADFGAPDFGNVLGTFALPPDPDRQTWKYRSVDPQLLLPRGGYLLLFGNEGDGDTEFLELSQPPNGNDRFADFTHIGFNQPGLPFTFTVRRSATLVLGEPEAGPPIPEPGSLILALSGLTLAAFARRNRR